MIFYNAKGLPYNKATLLRYKYGGDYIMPPMPPPMPGPPMGGAG